MTHSVVGLRAIKLNAWMIADCDNYLFHVTEMQERINSLQSPNLTGFISFQFLIVKDQVFHCIQVKC